MEPTGDLELLTGLFIDNIITTEKTLKNTSSFSFFFCSDMKVAWTWQLIFFDKFTKD